MNLIINQRKYGQINTVNKYKNTYYRTIKMKPANGKSNTYIDFNKQNNKEGPNLKLVIMLEYQIQKYF